MHRSKWIRSQSGGRSPRAGGSGTGRAWRARSTSNSPNQREIDDIAFRLYGIEGVDRRAIEEGVAAPTPSDEETEESEDDS